MTLLLSVWKQTPPPPTPYKNYYSFDANVPSFHCPSESESRVTVTKRKWRCAATEEVVATTSNETLRMGGGGRRGQARTAAVWQERLQPSLIDALCATRGTQCTICRKSSKRGNAENTQQGVFSTCCREFLVRVALAFKTDGKQIPPRMNFGRI